MFKHHKSIQGILCILSMGSAHVSKAELKASTLCVGNHSAKLGLIYVHDADDEEPSPQERSNRELLTRISQTLDFRMSIPRGNRPCPPPLKKTRCWKFLNSEMVAESNLFIQEQSDSCLKNQKKRVLLGFGNGAELVSRIYQNCLEPKQDHIAVEASYEPVETPIPSLKSCGRITYVLGNYSQENFNRFELLKSKLQTKGGHLDHEVFEGSYVFPFLLVMKILKSASQHLK